MDKINLAEMFERFDEVWSPKIVSSLNDYDVQLAKFKDEFVWHKHEETDDFFLVIRGHIVIQLRDRDVELGPGELFVVSKGVEHCPRSNEGADVLLIEPRGTTNTGDAGGELTAVKERI